MKSRTRKLSALLLATVMAMSFAACGGNPTGGQDSTGSGDEKLYYNKEGFPIVNETITINVAGVQGTTKDWQNTYMVRKIEEMMGIKMNCTSYLDTTAWTTQYAAMITTDELPDLMINANLSRDVTNQNGEEGILLDLSQYLDIMPNFAKFLKENPEYAAYNTAPDGGIYSLDRVRPVETPLYTLYVLKADQEKYGFSVKDIKTTEDFYNVLKSIKAQDPDRIPLSLTIDGNSGQRAIWVLRTAFGIFSVNNCPVLGVDEQGVINLDDISDNYRAYLTYLNRLWEEKLLDQESFIMTSEEYRAKTKAGEAVFFHDWSFLGVATGQDESVYEEYDALSVLTSEYNEVPTYVHFTPFSEGSRVLVSAHTKYPEAICRLIDYAFTEEGQTFFYYGCEGETFDYVDDGYGNQTVDSSNYWDSSKYESIDAWRKQEVVIWQTLNLIEESSTRSFVDHATDEQLEDMIFNDENHIYTKEAFHEKYIRAQAEVERYPSYLPLAFTSEESEETSQYTTDMNLLLSQFKAQFITGEKSTESDWDAYVKQIKVFWDKIQPSYQAAQDRVNAN